MSASILYLSYDGLTSHLGQSQVFPYIEGLANRGHRFSIISFEAIDSLAELGEKVSADVARLGIDWHPRRFRSRPPLVSKLIDQMDFELTARKVVANGDFDIVHCRSYVAAEVGQKLKKRFALKFLFDMRGFWVDTRLEGGSWPSTNPFYRFLYNSWKTKEAKFIEDADEIVVLTEAARQEVESWHAYKGCNISVIPCSLNYDSFCLPTEETRKEARDHLGIGDQHVVLTYLGSLGTVYLFQEMLHFFAALKHEHPGARFLLIGNHDPKQVAEVAQSISPDLSPEDFRYVRCVHAEVPYWLSAGDLAIFFYLQTYSSLAVSPTKLGECLAVGLPVVGNTGVGDVKAIVERFSAGCVLEDLSTASMPSAVSAIERYIGTDRVALRARSRPYYDINRAIGMYDDIYKRLSNNA